MANKSAPKAPIKKPKGGSTSKKPSPPMKKKC